MLFRIWLLFLVVFFVFLRSFLMMLFLIVLVVVVWFVVVFLFRIRGLVSFKRGVFFFIIVLRVGMVLWCMVCLLLVILVRVSVVLSLRIGIWLVCRCRLVDGCLGWDWWCLLGGVGVLLVCWGVILRMMRDSRGVSRGVGREVCNDCRWMKKLDGSW